MLQHFTWHQFLIAALLLSLIWYAGVILLFYRKELDDLLNGRLKAVKQTEPLPHVWDEEDFDKKLEEEDNLMGKPALPEGMTQLGMAQFGFAPKVREPISDAKETRLGIVPDVLEELKSIFYILERENGHKEDFISLFGLVSAKYPKIRNTANQQALNEYIREHLPFDISEEELDHLWQ
jgi:hypothetical protein